MKKVENEVIKHLVFACVASNDGKKNSGNHKIRKFDKKVIDEYYKEKRITSKYARKENEINTAIKVIDKIRDPKVASYNVSTTKDQNGVGCYSISFSVKYNEENVLFGFHIPKYSKGIKFGNNNYPKIGERVSTNTPALNTVLQTNEIFEGGLSALELYA